jgi:hypothetical protein
MLRPFSAMAAAGLFLFAIAPAHADTLVDSYDLTSATPYADTWGGPSLTLDSSPAVLGVPYAFSAGGGAPPAHRLALGNGFTDAGSTLFAGNYITFEPCAISVDSEYPLLTSGESYPVVDQPHFGMQETSLPPTRIEPNSSGMLLLSLLTAVASDSTPAAPNSTVYPIGLQFALSADPSVHHSEAEEWLALDLAHWKPTIHPYGPYEPPRLA